MSEAWQDVLWGAGTMAVVVLATLVVHGLVMRAAMRLPGAGRGIRTLIIGHVRRPSQLLVAAVATLATVPALELSDVAEGRTRHGVALVVIAAIGWLLVRLIGAGTEIMSRHLNLDDPDNVRARRAQTQAMIARRIGAVVVVIITAAVMLTTFPAVRTLGASMLASAGIAGLVLGLAAQQTLGNVFAGVQIALSEPITLDDVVVVEGEWGRVEEITFTYVVVRTWDERRVVLPISYFTTTPFENWTHTRPELVGSVILHVDHCAPVDRIRAEFERIVHASPLWDGRKLALQVIDAHERTIELRGVLSGRSSGDVWDLRCAVREGLMAFLATEHPEALPRMRAMVAPADEAERLRASGERATDPT